MIVTAGLYAFLKMQRTEDPTVTIRTGIVAAIYPGATSEQVEKPVTMPFTQKMTMLFLAANTAVL